MGSGPSKCSQSRKENRICINSLATGDVVLTSCGVKCAVGTQEARRRFLLSVEGMRTEETLKPGLCGRQHCGPPTMFMSLPQHLYHVT